MNETQIDSNTMLSLVTNGDCSRLSPENKLQYYKARCEAAGLDPRCQPFEFIKMNGKEVLYARKECSNQLSALHGIVCEVISQVTEAGIRTVTVRAHSKDKRQTDEIGCVNVEGLKGDALCNAYMKAMTKAKRRAILSICGLGMTDETELETIPGVNEKLKEGIEDESPKQLKPAIQRLVNKPSSQFDGDKWKNVVLHFGKNKGKTLGELEPRSLSWYRDEWKPKPFKGVISSQDSDLRNALDAYAEYREEEKTIQNSPENLEELEDTSWEPEHPEANKQLEGEPF